MIDDDKSAGHSRPAWRHRYCPLESGETVEVSTCDGCPYKPEPPFHVCAAPKQAKPRRRGFWDREPSPLD